MKHPIRMILLLILVCIGLGLMPVSAQTTVTWSGRYYNNPDLQSPARFTREDTGLTFNWGTGSPSTLLPADNFSVSWTTSTFFSGGTYRFYVFADDGVRLSLGNSVLIDTFEQARPGQLLSADITLSASFYDLQVDYRDLGGEAYLYLDWESYTGDADSAKGPGFTISPLENATWTARYYNNRTLQDPPSAIITEGSSYHDWGSGAPLANMSADSFSARWQTTLTLDGTYRLEVTADDGVRVYVDNVLYIDEWHDARDATYTATVSLNAGPHTIIIEYYENGGLAFMNFDMLRIGDSSGRNALPGGIWTVEYFEERTPGTVPVRSELSFNPQENWGLGAPEGLPVNDFSIRWTSRPILSAGNYRLSLQADDGVRVIIDGELVIDEWHTAQARVYTADVSLASGPHTIVIEYFEANGVAFLNYNFTRTGDYQPGVTVTDAQLTITAPTLNVRSGPNSVTASVIVKAREGEVYAVVGRNADNTWWQIQLDDGRTGWVFGSFVDVVNGESAPITSEDTAEPPPPGTGYFLMTTADLNIRSTASTRSGIRGQIPQGGSAEIIGRNSRSTWYYVNYNGIVGWVSASFVRLPANATDSVIPIQN